MKKICNLLFDLDGTLVDSSRTIITCIEYALEQVGYDAAGGTISRSLIGMPLLDIFRNEFEMTQPQAESAIAHYREHYEFLEQAGSEVYENVEVALNQLRQGGYFLYIATVKPTAIAEKVLVDLELRSHFDGIAGASMSHERRDKSRIIAYALEKFDLDPSQSLMIGDRDQDILGARANGMPSIAVSYGFGSREELDAAGPDHVVGHSGEIVSLLMNPFVAK